MPAWGVMTIADYFFSKMITNSSYFHINHWYDLMHGEIDADVVVMGNSRAWVQVDPTILDSILCTNTYNLGMDGSAINRQIRKYNIFRLYNRKPKLIIQNIDFNTLQYIVGYEREQFFPYFWDRGVREEFYSSEPISFWEKYVPLYRYYHSCSLGTLYCIMNASRILTKGYQGQSLQWDGSAFRKVQSIRFAPNDTSLVMFDEYLSKAKTEGIEIVFMYAPQYIGATRKIENLKEMHDVYQKYADKYDIPILDYTYSDICYDTAYFYNAMHMNKDGAEIFSRILANDIKRLKVFDNNAK